MKQNPKIHIESDIFTLCQAIDRYGKRSLDGVASVRFGDIANLGKVLSTSLQNVMKFAKEHRLILYHGQSLFDGRDSSLVVKLTRKFRDIQRYYQNTGHLLPNSDHGNLWIEVDGWSKNHFSWITNVTEVGSCKTSYCVQYDVGEWDDDQELPKRCFPLLREEERSQATITVHQQIVRSVGMATVKSHPQIFCYPADYYEPCPPIEVSAMEDVDICQASPTTKHLSLNFAEADTVKISRCPIRLHDKKPIPYEEIYIRPLIKLNSHTKYTSFFDQTSRKSRAKTEIPQSHKLSTEQTNSRKIDKDYYSRSIYANYRSTYMDSRARSELRERKPYISLYF